MSGPRRVLVTGATGTVGREVVRALLASGDDVAVRVGTRRPYEGDPRVERVALDYDDVGTLDAAFRGVDAFFFVSPLTDSQVVTGLAALDAARRAGVAACVRLSSRATGWDDVSELRRWHRELEAAIRASGMAWTMLRPCSFMQNVLGAPAALVRARGVLSMPMGHGRIPFVDARDLGDVAARCLRDTAAHHGATYVLTGDEALSGEALAAAMSAVRASPVRYVASSPDAARAAAIAAGAPVWLVDSGLRVYARAEHGEEGEVTETLRALLGRPATTFADFVARHADAFAPG